MNSRSVGIVIPTLGDRPEYLAECLSSVRLAGPAVVAVVATPAVQEALRIAGIDPDIWIDDPGGGAARAINAGIAHLPEEIEAVGWIGDDDLLERNTLLDLEQEIGGHAAAVFGACRYIDNRGSELFVNRSSRLAPVLMRIGPNLLPQPGSLIARSAWVAVGGLDESLRWTFDLDLFIRLRKVGRLHRVDRILASFRWHPGSLTAGARQGSVDEASKVRLQHMPPPLRVVARMWEPAVRRVILIAGNRVTGKITRRNSAGGL